MCNTYRNSVFIDETELSDVAVDVKLPVAGAGRWGDIGLLGQKVHRLEVVGGFHGVNRLPMAFCNQNHTTFQPLINGLSIYKKLLYRHIIYVY